MKQTEAREKINQTKKALISCWYRIEGFYCVPAGIAGEVSDLQLTEFYQLDDSLRTALNIQFLHDIGDVITHRLLANKQLPSDIASGFVLHEQFKYLTFTVGQQELAVMIGPLQWCHPSLPGYVWSNKVKGYSQLILCRMRGECAETPIIWAVPSKYANPICAKI